MPHKHAHQHHAHVPAPYVTAFISAHATEAKIVGLKFGLLPSVILAQSALESDYGRKAPGNAFFGKKGTKASAKTIQIATHEEIKGQRKAETDAFEAYDNYAAAAEGYATLITTDKRYASLLAVRHDAEAYATNMGKTPYATGSGYGELMVKIIRGNNLTQYDK